MPHQNHDIACAKTWSCVLTPFSVAYTTSISGRQRALVEFLRMTTIRRHGEVGEGAGEAGLQRN